MKIQLITTAQATSAIKAQKFPNEIIGSNKKVLKLLLKGIKKEFNSPTMSKMDALYKESIETISNVGKRQKAANKIARFAKRSLQFEEDPSLYGGLGDLKKPLENFNDLFLKLLDTEFESVEAKPTKESKLFKYKDFLSIKEEVEMVGGESKIDGSENESVSGKIKVYFYKHVDYDRWVIEKTKLTQLSAKFEEANKKAAESMEIDAEDIIGILRLFNKAYKVYTTSAIPSGRSGGKVSTKTFLEYENLGPGQVGTPAQPGTGPWRNNRIFNIFEVKIFKNILENKEYRPLFNKDSSVLLTDGTKKAGGGNDLKLFITKLLDGDKMYNDDGAIQKELLLKMFNITDDGPTKTKDPNTKDPEGKINVGKIANKKSSSFYESKINTEKESVNVLYLDGNVSPLYLYIIETDLDDNVYLKFSRSIKTFEKYQNKFEINKGDLKQEINTSPNNYIFFTKIKKEDLKVGDIKLKSINIDTLNTVEEDFRVLNTYTLVDSDKKPVFIKVEKTSYIDNKDETNIKKLKEKLEEYLSKK